MEFMWPGSLILLGLVPLVTAAYIWAIRRRRRYAVRYSSLALIRAAIPKQSSLRRHLPFALFMLALVSLVLAFSRPAAVTRVPIGQVSIILAIDVSRSMIQADIPPTRLEAAQKAAQSFIEGQLPGTHLGIVAFAGFAELIQEPTADQEDLLRAIDSLTTARRTAVGSAILESIDAISERNTAVEPSVYEIPVTGSGQAAAPDEKNYVPDIIVLLTDGASNSGYPPLEAAQQAANRGIRVFTIGFGTETGEWGLDGNRSDPFGGNSFGWFSRGLDEETLRAIADMTGGEYYSASSADELQDVFASLPTYLVTQEELMEISVAFAAVGALLAALAIVLALLWHPLT